MAWVDHGLIAKVLTRMAARAVLVQRLQLSRLPIDVEAMTAAPARPIQIADSR
jgi:hypothetical protein